jgi:TolB-like protein
MKRLFLSLLALLCMATALPAAPQPSLAVLPLKEEGARGLGDVSDTMNTLVTRAFAESGAFRLVERHQIGTVLEESRYQHSGMVDDATIVELGRHLGVRFVLVGSYLPERSGTSLSVTLSLRLVDVENAVITRSFLENAEAPTLGRVVLQLSHSLADHVASLKRAEDRPEGP